jgi:hypothetical protein
VLEGRAIYKSPAGGASDYRGKSGALSMRAKSVASRVISSGGSGCSP